VAVRLEWAHAQRLQGICHAQGCGQHRHEEWDALVLAQTHGPLQHRNGPRHVPLTQIQRLISKIFCADGFRSSTLVSTDVIGSTFALHWRCPIHSMRATCSRGLSFRQACLTSPHGFVTWFCQLVAGDVISGYLLGSSSSA
jgi:hypothetical protein